MKYNNENKVIFILHEYTSNKEESKLDLIKQIISKHKETLEKLK